MYMGIPRSFAGITRTKMKARFHLGAQVAMVMTPFLCVPVARAQQDVQRVSVANRSRSDYDPLGIRVGTMVFYPAVKASASIDDNIYAQKANKISDEILSVSPSLMAIQTTPLSNARVTISSQHDRYASRSTENADDYRATGTAQYGIGTPLVLNGGFTLARLSEDRTNLGSYSQSAQPIRYTTLESELGAQQALGSLGLGLSGRARRVTYSQGLDAMGAPIDYSFRNFNTYQGTARVGFSRTGLSQIYVSGTYDRQIYDRRPGDANFDPLTSYDRTSSGGRIELGYSRQVSSLIYLDAQIGYLHQKFADSRLKTVSGLAYSANLLWNFTPLTSITGRLTRAVDETASPLTAGNLRSEGTIQVDHELLRNLIISANGRYAKISPSGPDASSDELEAGLSARLLLNRRISVEGDVRHRSRASDNTAIAFSANTATVGLTFGF